MVGRREVGEGGAGGEEGEEVRREFVRHGCNGVRVCEVKGLMGVV